MSRVASVFVAKAVGAQVRIRLTPRSGFERVEGLIATAEGPALQLRVRAVPSDRAANAAAERLLADWLGLAKSRVSVCAGYKSRIEMLIVDGDGPDLCRLIGGRIAALGPQENQ